MLEAISAGLLSLLTPQAVLFMVVGVLYGLVIGILPGLGGVVAMLKAGDVHPILTVGEARYEDPKDVPNALELVSDPAKKRLVSALINIQRVHRSFFGPPNMPPEAVANLRAGIMAAMSDPQVGEAAKRLNLALNPMDGATQQRVVSEIYDSSADITKVLKASTDSIK